MNNLVYLVFVAYCYRVETLSPYTALCSTTSPLKWKYEHDDAKRTTRIQSTRTSRSIQLFPDFVIQRYGNVANARIQYTVRTPSKLSEIS